MYAEIVFSISGILEIPKQDHSRLSMFASVVNGETVAFLDSTCLYRMHVH